jgi:serine/threonine-protein kinase
MPLLGGGTLEQRLKQRARDELPLPSLGEISDQLRQIASALDYAHERGIIHRDIKSSNVMFDNHGRPYLVDFGIAKLRDAAPIDRLRKTGAPAYMPPEQWRPEEYPADHTVGAGLLMISGQMPFEAPTPA